MATTKAVVTQSYLTDIANAIIAKGGATDPLKPSEMADAIANIPTSGGGWTRPADWPDIKAILAADKASSNPHGGEGDYRVAFLVHIEAGVSLKANTTLYYEEGSSYQGNGNVVTKNGTFSFSTTGLHWFIVFGGDWDASNNYIGVYPPNGSVMASACLWACGEGENISKVCGYGYQAFPYSFNSLVKVDDLTLFPKYRLVYTSPKLVGRVCIDGSNMDLDLGAGGSWATGCSLLEEIGGVLIRTVKKTFSGFSGCVSLKYIPDYIDMSGSITNSGTVPFSGSCSLLKIPKVIVINKENTYDTNFNFYNCINIDPKSIATFDNDADPTAIVDGFSSFSAIPSPHPSAGKTSDATSSTCVYKMTLPIAIRNIYFGGESGVKATMIAEAFSNHGWTLAWA